ncbi:MAG: hypothetical protein IPO41_05590 [Acidobacteria bacterium]|nr:hypothetical protein [Acidobacteriota bacterium]
MGVSADRDRSGRVWGWQLHKVWARLTQVVSSLTVNPTFNRLWSGPAAGQQGGNLWTFNWTAPLPNVGAIGF